MTARKSTLLSNLTAGYVRSILDYDPDTGVLTWRERTDIKDALVRSKWNNRYAGTCAGAVHPGGQRSLTKYRVLGINGRTYRAHRVAWLHVYGEWPPGEIDHANGDGTDNRIANLRLATRAQNCANTKAKKGNVSGIKGVTTLSWSSGTRFQAQISKNGGAGTRYLGTFDTAEEAHDAYMEAAREQYGGFARAR